MARGERVAASGNHGQGKDSSARRRLEHFFKIILPTTIQDKKMMIPPMFSRIHGDELSDVATLDVPADGRAWKVGVTRSNGDILFDNAWPEFVEYYSIKPGYFLVFTYKGMSCFNVLVFDNTACEIQYPCMVKEGRKREQCSLQYEDDDGGDDTSLEILGSNPCSSEGVTRHCETPSFKRYQNPIRGDNIVVKSTSRDLEPQGMSHSAEDKSRKVLIEGYKEEGKLNAVNIFPRTRSRRLSRENDRTLQAALMFKPSHPSYLLVLRFYHIYKKMAFLPREFAAKNLTKVGSHVTFQVPDGREWSVGVKRRSKRVYLYQGFREFIMDNNLKEGDVCVLEKIMEENNVLKTTIFRSESAQSGLRIDGPNEMPYPVPEKGTDKCLKEHKLVKTEVEDANGLKKRKLKKMEKTENSSSVKSSLSL